MTWKLKNPPKTLKVTHKLATEFAEMDPAPGDRPFSERRLQVYQRLLAANQFRPVTWAKAYCKETMQSYRVNGKHTSRMLAAMGAMPEFYVILEDYECDTLEDVAKLYSTFDSGMQSRKAQEIYTSFAYTITELQSVPKKVIGLVVSGVSFHLAGGKPDLRTPAERAEYLFDYSDFVIWVDNLFSWSKAEKVTRSSEQSVHLRRSPVVAACFAFWQKDKVKATEFCEAVRDETGVDPNTPDRKLGRYLRSITVKGGGSISGSKELVYAREIYVKCINAWNAWRKGEDTRLQYFSKAPIPDVA